MAKIVSSNIDSRPVSKFNPVWQIISVGVVLGILYCGLTLYLSRFVGLASAAGDIATIIVATVGIIVMLNLRMARPLLVAAASAISLWGLSKLTDGLGWFEVIIWSILIYTLAYFLFSWLTRYKKLAPILIATIIIVIIVRLTITV